MSDGRVLVDTNILVYSVDRRDARKQTAAATALDELATAGLGVLSAQTLAEYYSALTSKSVLAEQVPAADAANQVADYAGSWTVVDVTALVVLEAIEGVRHHRLAYRDAQIWAAAKLNQIEVIYSEDGPTGSTIGGVRFVNPLETARATP
jgi:predicted nucleic acid-binding protein